MMPTAAACSRPTATCLAQAEVQMMRILLGWLADLFYGLGQLALPGGRIGRAMARYFLHRCLSLNPGHERAQGYRDYLYGVWAVERGDPDAGLRLLRRAARALPQDPAVALDAGVALAICGQYEAAATTLSRLLQEHPHRLSGERQLWSALAWSHLRLRNYQQALETARAAATAGCASAQLRLVTLFANLACGDGFEAGVLAGLLRSHVRLLPNVLEFAEQMAEDDRPGLADQVLGALPADLQAHGLRLIASSSIHGRRWRAARWALARLQTFARERVAYLVLESELYLHEQQFPQALAAAEQAVAQAEPSTARGQRTGSGLGAAEEQLGEVLLVMGRSEEAFPHFVRALAEGSLSALAGGAVALRLVEQGRIQEARQVFRFSRRGAELGVAYAHLATALILLEEGQTGEALNLTELAWEAYRDLPAWAAQPSVRETLSTYLRRLAQDLAERAEAASQPDLLTGARRLLRNLERPASD